MVYNSRKAGQVAAYMISKCGHQMNRIRLIKLTYLAERENLKQYACPMLYDEFVSMDNGLLLDQFNQYTKSGHHPQGWREFIRPRQGSNGKVVVRKQITNAEADELNDGEIEILDGIDNDFRSYTTAELIEYIHALPEWRDPKKSVISISYKELFIALDKNEEEATELEDFVEDSRKMLGA